MMFTKIAIIGTGNIGTWMFKTLQNQAHLSVVSVLSRKIETLPQDSDLYIFALKDDVYGDVLQQISFKMTCAVHTSGSLSQNILAPFAEKYGVVYPYQTITTEIESQPNKEMGDRRQKVGEKSYALPVLRSSGLKNIPICIEGSDLDFENALLRWAESVFSIVHKINEKQRFAMHLAAVFANNFTNAMYGIAYQIFEDNNLDWSLIFPLLENSLEKAKHNDPRLVQTGPAKRNDVSIMDKHCKALENEDLKMLYKMVSSIINH